MGEASPDWSENNSILFCLSFELALFPLHSPQSVAENGGSTKDKGHPLLFLLKISALG